MVLADGSIINVSPTSYSDMYFALRGGGGSNFGVVTKFDMFTFEQGLLWGGSTYYSPNQNGALFSAFYNFVNNAPTENYAHLYLAYVYTAALGGYAGVTGPVVRIPFFCPHSSR